MLHFKNITEDNFDAVINMKRPEGENYLASNEYSLAQAWLYREANDVYPFAIYEDDIPAGFLSKGRSSFLLLLRLLQCIFLPEADAVLYRCDSGRFFECLGKIRL